MVGWVPSKEFTEETQHHHDSVGVGDLLNGFPSSSTGARLFDPHPMAPRVALWSDRRSLGFPGALEEGAGYEVGEQRTGASGFTVKHPLDAWPVSGRPRVSSGSGGAPPSWNVSREVPRRASRSPVLRCAHHLARESDLVDGVTLRARRRRSSTPGPVRGR